MNLLIRIVFFCVLFFGGFPFVRLLAIAAVALTFVDFAKINLTATIAAPAAPLQWVAVDQPKRRDVIIDHGTGFNKGKLSDGDTGGEYFIALSGLEGRLGFRQLDARINADDLRFLATDGPALAARITRQTDNIGEIILAFIVVVLRCKLLFNNPIYR